MSPFRRFLAGLVLSLAALPVQAAGLPDTVARIKPAIVGVGTLQKLRRPPFAMLGTGFAVADGRHLVTNAHVLPEVLDVAKSEVLAVVVGVGQAAEVRTVQRLAVDRRHDLALLRMDGAPLPALSLATGGAREGETYAFTGFPIGAVLGPYPVTHHGLVSAISPIALPADQSRQLDPEQIRALRNPFLVYQLDATAYPGNSGSPLYEPETGAVVGVLNSGFVQGSKEAQLKQAVSAPSGISYAIPVEHIRALLKANGL
ncbi:MAG: trypsin-like peptidase domain-containing protein [Gammaproteobacteria bacterium]|nr:trypsin-like peptidase domain-containing protein [Gammaproteobacteria bacterium]